MSNKNELTDAVKRAISDYLDHLGNEQANNIHGMVIRHVERAMLELVVEKTQGNQTKAAGMLGISRNTLRRKLEQYRILK